MSREKSKRPSGSQNRQASAKRLAEALERKDAIEITDYAALLGPPPLDDASRSVEWAAKVGTQLIWETLRDPSLTTPERRKTVANLIARVGLVSSKSQFAGRIAAIERRLATESAPTASKVVEEPSDKPLQVPARGTALHAAWEARGEIPAEGVNVIEVPSTSRTYARWLAVEAKRKTNEENGRK